MIETRQAELADQLIAHLDGLAEGVPLRTKLVVLQARRAMLDHGYLFDELIGAGHPESTQRTLPAS